jgi:hypothetical protein
MYHVHPHLAHQFASERLEEMRKSAGESRLRSQESRRQRQRRRR